MNTIRTISDVLRGKADETKKGISSVENRRDVFVPYGRVHAEAVPTATRLAEAGIGPGDRVIFQVSENRGLIRAFWGCVYAGVAGNHNSFVLGEGAALTGALVGEYIQRRRRKRTTGQWTRRPMESTGRGTGKTRWKVTDRRNGGEARDRDAGEPVKVLVAGGTGVTGRLVRGMLGVVDGIELAYTSRKKPDDGPGRHFPLRIAAGHNEICRVFRKHDWVVNCTGPFEVHADSLARARIDSGTGYIDVNDSIDARRAIMALDGDALREGVPVLTGFGLCPGLSTALLILGARAAGVEEVRDVRVDLRIGADQESGAESVESMFRTIRGGYRAMLGGAIVEVRRGRCGAVGRDHRRPGDRPGFLQNDHSDCCRHRCGGRGEAGRAGVPGSRRPPPAPRTGPRLRPRCGHPYRGAA